jgi:hypothetical protein
MSGLLRCLSPEDDDDEPRDEGYCEMHEAGECPVPCASTCYLAPCEHGLDAGCKVTCARCGHECSSHWGVNGKSGEIYRGCMGPDGEDSKSCPCDLFAEARP